VTGHHALEKNVYYGSQWFSTTDLLPTVFKISVLYIYYSVFNRFVTNSL